ncbi:MAG: DUF2905 domain-containing protein [Vicinamibacterales bacterium]
MGKWLIVVGLAIAALGVLVTVGVPLGRLPGDFVFRRGNVTVAFPFATSILLSVLLSLVFYWLRR